jgi:ribosomal protein S18 acetylase RimI-like enzyme
MSEGVIVRTCTNDDIAALVGLGAQTFRETFESLNAEENMELYLQSNFTGKRISDELSEQGALFFIAEHDGSAIGYGRIRNSKGESALNGYRAMEIERIYAVKNSIGKGVGSALMQACLDHAKKSGYDLVWLGVWEHNHRALEFYAKWGFEKFSQHTFMLGHDAQTDFLLKKKI